jgi:hypothetical protein
MTTRHVEEALAEAAEVTRSQSRRRRVRMRYRTVERRRMRKRRRGGEIRRGGCSLWRLSRYYIGKAF